MIRASVVVAASCIALIVPVGGRLAAEPGVAREVSVEDRYLAQLPAGLRRDQILSILFSPTGREVAFLALAHQRYVGTIGQQPIDGFANPIVFSPDGKRAAYRLLKDGEVYVVNGRKRAGPFEWAGHLTFSPDSRRFVFAATEDGVCRLQGAPPAKQNFAQIEHVVFSPDSKRVAYAANVGRKTERIERHVLTEMSRGKWFMVVDDQPSDAYDWIGPAAFSPDGTQVAYPAGNDLERFMVIDGRRGETFTGVGEPVFSPDGTQVAYAAWQAWQWAGRQEIEHGVMVVGHAKHEGFDQVITKPVFSPDGLRVAYGVENFGKRFVMNGEKPGDEFDDVGEPVFSPDGTRLAYRATVNSKSFIVVVDERPRQYDLFMTSLVPGPSGMLLARQAWKEGETVNLGNDESDRFEWVGQPVFSPDSEVAAFPAASDGRWFAVLGHRRSEPFDEVWPPVFSADGEAVAFGARKGAMLWWKTLHRGTSGG